MKLHIANIAFEEEIDGRDVLPHPNFTYLASLPLLYMDSRDTLDPTSDYTSVEYWGLTEKILPYLAKIGQNAPPLDVVKTLSSKLFTFDKTRSLLLHTKKDLELIPFDQPLLKSLHGFSGRGHCMHQERFLSFCEKEWQRGHPVICEPLHERAFDFSTQWHIDEHNKITYLGALYLQNSPSGSFRSVSTKLPHPVPIEHTRCYVEEACKLGFFGNLGVDAFVTKNGTPLVCEVNPRKTMGFVALQIAAKRECDITLSFTKHGNTKLPVVSGAKQMTVIEHF